MNKSQLQQLHALAQAASPGPWCQTSIRDINVRAAGRHYSVIPAVPTASVIAFTGEEGDIQGLADAKFIAGANPAAVLKLLAEIARLDHALDEALAESDRRQQMCDALAEGVATHFNEFIGEHSSGNCPWNNALAVMDLKPEFTHCTCGAAVAKVAAP
jgi:hypothetical protein